MNRITIINTVNTVIFSVGRRHIWWCSLHSNTWKFIWVCCLSILLVKYSKYYINQKDFIGVFHFLWFEAVVRSAAFSFLCEVSTFTKSTTIVSVFDIKPCLSNKFGIRKSSSMPKSPDIRITVVTSCHLVSLFLELLPQI
jgi:hypothetical protein